MAVIPSDAEKKKKEWHAHGEAWLAASCVGAEAGSGASFRVEEPKSNSKFLAQKPEISPFRMRTT